MTKRHANLIERIADIENLRIAYEKTANNKRLTFGYLEFKEYAFKNLLSIQEELLDGAWEQGQFREFTVYEPKPRLISALDFKDRVAQHALVNIIGPIFESTLLPYTFACRKGMGTHAGVRHVQSQMRKTGATFFLKTDYSRFFPSIDRSRLHFLIEKKIKCKKTLEIICAMVPKNGKGLPIGSLTSQLFANVYGGVIDRFIHFELGARKWARYMDDIVILSSNPYELREWYEKIEQTSKDRLGLGISKWQISSVNRGVNFLGYRIWPRHKLLRKSSVVRAKRKIKKYLHTGDKESLNRFIGSWRGHASHADTCHLFNYLEKTYAIKCH